MDLAIQTIANDKTVRSDTKIQILISSNTSQKRRAIS